MRIPGLLHPAAPRSSAVPCHAAPGHGEPRRWQLLLPLALAVALGGCSGSYRWVKEGLSTSLGDAKYASCKSDAEQVPHAGFESEDEHAARIRRQADRCMRADGWSLNRVDGTEPREQLSYRSSYEAPGRELRVAQTSESAGEKPSSKADDKPGKADEKPAAKEIKKEVHVPAPADDSGGDDEE